MVYTLTTKELKELFISFGDWYLYDGTSYWIKKKSLGAGVYKVWSEKR